MKKRIFTLQSKTEKSLEEKGRAINKRKPQFVLIVDLTSLVIQQRIELPLEVVEMS